MKKILVVILAALGLSSVSSAATILCTADEGTSNIITNNISDANPTQYSCGGVVATAGYQITGVAVSILASFNDGAAGSNQLDVFGNSSLGATQNVQTSIGTLSGDNGGFETGSFFALAPTGSLGSSTVQISWDFNGFAAPNNATVLVALETQETLIPTGVPEPSTFLLLGSALTGLGVAARRRKA